MNDAPSHNIKKRQYLAFALLLLMVGAATSLAYHAVHPDQIAYRRAESRFENKRFSEAIPLYENAIGLGLKNDTAILHLSRAYQVVGKTDRAVFLLETEIGKTAAPAAVLLLCDLYAAQSRWEEILSLVKRHPRMLADQPAAMMQLADAYRNTKALAQAADWYRRALEKDPESLYGRFRLAEILAWTKRYDEAIALFRSILDDYPEHRGTRLFLARALGWSGQIEDAISEYQKLLGERT